MAGDEDGNGLADCSDPACASTKACNAGHRIGGQVVGLAGTGLTLTTNGKAVALAAPAAGGPASFAFPPMAAGTTYNVVVDIQPSQPWQTCEVTGATGTGTLESSDLDTVRVTCTTNRLAVGGTLDWLRVGQTIELALNDGVKLTVGASGRFSFGAGTEVASGASYAVTVSRQPPAQDCQVTRGSGTIAGNAIADVTVTCRCFTVARLGVDRRWAQWKLPDSPGNPRSYSATEDTVVDCVTGLEWQRTVPTTKYTQADAATYCDGLTLGDQSDWRLPTAIELISLVNFAPGSGVIDQNIFRDLSIGPIWTSEVTAGQSGRGWSVNFNGGFLRHDTAVAEPNQVRCVR